MDGGAWWAAVHGVAKSRIQLSDFTFTFHFHALEKEMATHSSVLAWRIPGMGEPGGLPSMGSHRVGHDWSDLAAAAAAVSFHLLFFCSCQIDCLVSLPYPVSSQLSAFADPFFYWTILICSFCMTPSPKRANPILLPRRCIYLPPYHPNPKELFSSFEPLLHFLYLSGFSHILACFIIIHPCSLPSPFLYLHTYF